MAVSWKVCQVKPSELLKTLQLITDERYRVFEVSPTPGNTSTEHSTSFTVVAYRLTRETNQKDHYHHNNRKFEDSSQENLSSNEKSASNST